MAKINKTVIQSYPGMDGEQNSYNGFLQELKITSHTKKINEEDLKKLIRYNSNGIFDDLHKLVDLFCRNLKYDGGSGGTGVAALQNKRNSVLIDNKEKCVKVIRERLSVFESVYHTINFHTHKIAS